MQHNCQMFCVSIDYSQLKAMLSIKCRNSLQNVSWHKAKSKRRQQNCVLIFLALARLLATLSGLSRRATGRCVTSALLRQKDCLDVGQDTTLGNGHAGQQLVQFLVVADGQLKMSRHNASLLVVACSVAREFQHLGSKVLHDRCQVYRGTSADTLSIISCNTEHQVTFSARNVRHKFKKDKYKDNVQFFKESQQIFTQQYKTQY